MIIAIFIQSRSLVLFRGNIYINGGLIQEFDLGAGIVP